MAVCASCPQASAPGAQPGAACAALAAAAAAGLFASSAGADAISDFYSGKAMTLVISTGAGGGGIIEDVRRDGYSVTIEQMRITFAGSVTDSVGVPTEASFSASLGKGRPSITSAVGGCCGEFTSSVTG